MLEGQRFCGLYYLILFFFDGSLVFIARVGSKTLGNSKNKNNRHVLCRWQNFRPSLLRLVDSLQLIHKRQKSRKKVLTSAIVGE